MKKLIVFSAFVLLTAIILNSCGGGGGGSTPPFSQADLVGIWHVSILQTGPTVSTGAEPGWIRGTANIVSSGSISVPALYTSGSGTTSTPGPDGIVWTINPSTGIITEMSGTYATDFHGKLAANKQLIVGTATNLNSQATTTTVQFRIIQKIVSNPSYTISHIAGKNFTLHQIESGASGDWMHAEGFTDLVSSGPTTTVTLSTPITKPSGTSGGGSPGTLSIDSSGFVSLDSNATFKGLVSPDKTYMIGTETDVDNSNIYRLTVVQFTDPSTNFSLAEIAGNWHFHGLFGGGIPAWVYESLSFDATNSNVTMTSLLINGQEYGTPAPAPINIDEFGNLTDPTDDSLHGTLSLGKDMLVTTQSTTIIGSPGSMLGVTVK